MGIQPPARQARDHSCKLCTYYTKLHDNLKGNVYHLLWILHVRLAN